MEQIRLHGYLPILCLRAGGLMHANLPDEDRRRRRAASTVLGVVLLLMSVTHADTPQSAFAAENAAAMDRMMAGMAIKPSGDIDRDFAAMMIPHHQGAIEMAMAELRYGHNEQLRRIAQEIIVEQKQEIAAMRLALGWPLPAAGIPRQ
jgi:hypothetical protein